MSRYSDYQEIKLIGRGNFGAAFLVMHKKDEKKIKYIAKKINLQSLNEKDRINALNEADLLKTMAHPNIVSYKDSFIEEDVLIIVMEYCEGIVVLIKRWRHVHYN